MSLSKWFSFLSFSPSSSSSSSSSFDIPKVIESQDVHEQDKIKNINNADEKNDVNVSSNVKQNKIITATPTLNQPIPLIDPSSFLDKDFYDDSLIGLYFGNEEIERLKKSMENKGNIILFKISNLRFCEIENIQKGIQCYLNNSKFSAIFIDIDLSFIGTLKNNLIIKDEHSNRLYKLFLSLRTDPKIIFTCSSETICSSKVNDSSHFYVQNDPVIENQNFNTIMSEKNTFLESKIETFLEDYKKESKELQINLFETMYNKFLINLKTKEEVNIFLYRLRFLKFPTKSPFFI